jgi:lipopolysaccharide transport protein LptA
MHRSIAKLSIGALTAALWCLAAAQSRSGPVVFDSETLTLDRQSNVFRLTKPRITQGDMRIEADRAVATGIDTDDGKWELEGHVRMEVDGIVLEADATTFSFSRQQLTRFDMRGSPASVEDRNSARRRPVRGGAASLQYDHTERTLRMAGDAVLYRGQNTIRSCSMVYDFDDESFESADSPDCSDNRMRITVERPDGQ